MTKQRALKMFKEIYQDFLKKFKGDKIAKQGAWNDFTDSLREDGDITEKQYNNWSNPF